MKVIEIVPAEAGWAVRTDAIDNALYFTGAMAAESAAVRLAHGLAEAGQSASVEVYDADGSIARRFVIPSLRLVK